MTAGPQLPALVPFGKDCQGEERGLGVSVITFKVVPRTEAGLLVLENTFHAKGGPARHLHHAQDEWFYAIESDFVLEIGPTRYELHPGDSIVAPKGIPHVWAHTGSGRGRILVAFVPAGKMEAFFREVTKANAMPPQDPQLWRDHGMELVGPPLKVDAP